MKNMPKMIAAALAAALCAGLAQPACAESGAAQQLGQCLYKNSSSAEKDQLIQWAYVTIGNTSAAKQVQSIPEAKRKQVTQAMKGTLSNLLIRSCPKESAAVLLSDPKNGAADAMEELTRLMMRDKVRAKVGEVLSLQGGSTAGDLLSGVSSILNKLK